MQKDVRLHNLGNIHRFWEEDQFEGAVQPACVVMSGALTYRLPRVQDANDMYNEQAGRRASIHWYSRTGTQRGQANAILKVVLPDLAQDNISKAVILLALEEQNLRELDWQETFPLLVTTLERVMVYNLKNGTDFDLVAAPMLYSNGESHKPLHTKVTSHNNAVASFNYYLRNAIPLTSGSMPPERPPAWTPH